MSFVILYSCKTGSKGENENKMQIVETLSEKQEYKASFNNPVIMQGSSFGNYFQAMYKVGRFDDMMKFTASSSINEYGSEKIMDVYKKMDFAYEIKLKSKNDNADGTITLNYEKQMMATKGMLRMNVIIEHDTVKLIIGDLKKKSIF